MNTLQIFQNNQFGEIRTTTIGNEPWFVGKDVAIALGYSKARNALAAHVDREDKKDAPIQGPLGGTQTMTIINESGLYSLIMASKLPTAKQFKRWVTSEVLPSIRKHGAYMTPDAVEKVLTDPDTIIKIATELKAEREKRLSLEAKAAEDHPKVVFANAVAASTSSILVGQLAKILQQNGINIGQNRLFAWLRDNGYLIKGGSQRNTPTQRAMEMGLFEIKESVHVDANGCNVISRTSKVTAKGQLYFINKFLGKTEASNVQSEACV